MKQRIILVASICACVLLASPAGVLAAPTIPAGADIYNFDSLIPGGDNSNYLSGQDNWVVSESGAGHHLYVNTVSVQGGSPPPGSGYLLTEFGGTTEHKASRVNDANWSFDLTSQPQFSLGMSMATDYTLGAYYGYGKVGVKNTVTNKNIQFGLNVEEWYYGVDLWDAQGVKHVGGTPRPTAKNQVWYFKLEVDTTANGGEGSGSVYTWQKDVHTDWQLVSGLESVNLMLATAGMDIANSNQLMAGIKTRLVSIDDIWVSGTPPPTGDLTIKKFFDCGSNGVKDYVDDNLLPGWEYHITGPSSYDQTLTTDGLGEIKLTGLDPGDYTIHETVWKDHAITTGNQDKVVTIAGGDDKTEMFGNVLNGDINQDGVVDSVDFTILKANYGLSPMTWVQGNLNPIEDNLVDSVDFTILKAYFGQGVPPGPGAVPEPASVALLIVGLAGMVLRRRAR